MCYILTKVKIVTAAENIETGLHPKLNCFIALIYIDMPQQCLFFHFKLMGFFSKLKINTSF